MVEKFSKNQILPQELELLTSFHRQDQIQDSEGGHVHVTVESPGADTNSLSAQSPGPGLNVASRSLNFT